MSTAGGNQEEIYLFSNSIKYFGDSEVDTTRRATSDGGMFHSNAIHPEHELSDLLPRAGPSAPIL